MILGVDVSNNNGLINWPLLAQSPVNIAVIKCSEGTAFHDDYYASNVKGAQAVGMHVGAYHFARPSTNTGRAEAEFFGRLVAQASSPWFYVIDLEDDRIAPDADLGAYLDDFQEAFMEITGRNAVVYSSHGYLRSHGLEGSTVYRGYDLWLASWSEAEPIKVPGWPAYLGWQFTAEGFLPGVGLVDLSLWREDALAR